MDNYTMTDYEYDVEINHSDPRSAQPSKILLELKNHQLASLYKAIHMEKHGCVKYDIKTNIRSMTMSIPNYHAVNIKDKVTMNTNIGILGDIVGYGKTITALSIIAASDVNDIHIHPHMNMSYCSSRNYSYISYSTTNNNILRNDNIIKSTLIIVPRGPVYSQWQKALQQNTTLKFLAIESLTYIKKHLPEMKENNYKEIIKFFNSYDVVLIKNTTLDVLFSYYAMSSFVDDLNISFIKRWKRIMIDEAHDISHKIPLMYYEYLWLISASYENILYSSKYHSNILHQMKDAINYDTINLILVKGKKEFVRDSFKIPLPKETYHLCKLNAKIDAIKKFISPEILEKINANDIVGVVRDLGGKSETEDSISDLITKELKREIHNKEIERELIERQDIPQDVKANKLKNIDNDLVITKNKLDDLTSRILELKQKMCAICMFEMENPIFLECTHSYCGLCIVKWLEKNMNCPECRHKIDMNKMIAIVKKKEAYTSPKSKILSKEDTLIKIIKDNPNGKYLIFSKYDSGFFKLMENLNANDITCSEMKGNTAHMNNVLEKFKNGEIKVILLNTNFAGSGIDISCATDVIIYHSMGLTKYQAIGRAQRVGRTDVLNVHYLCYEHEMNM
jgi:superfamily II DNA or RNA helicase